MDMVWCNTTKFFWVEWVTCHVFIALFDLMSFHLFLLTFWNFVFGQPHLWKSLHVLEAVPVEIIRFQHCIHSYDRITSCVYLNPLRLWKPISLSDIKVLLLLGCRWLLERVLLHNRNNILTLTHSASSCLLCIKFMYLVLL